MGLSHSLDKMDEAGFVGWDTMVWPRSEVKVGHLERGGVWFLSLVWETGRENGGPWYRGVKEGGKRGVWRSVKKSVEGEQRRWQQPVSVGGEGW